MMDFIYLPGIEYGALRPRMACTYCMSRENMNAEFWWGNLFDRCHLEDREINGKVIVGCILGCEAERWIFLANHCVIWWALEIALWKWILLLVNVISELTLFYHTDVTVHL